MFGINLQKVSLRKLLTLMIVVVLISGLVSCSDRLPELPPSPEASLTIPTTPQISEVSPPEIIQQLRQAIGIYQPQVTIQSPKADQVFEDNTITVKLQVQDLPIFQSELDLGPYLEVILDNKPDQKIYDLNQSLVLSDLEPGTHTLRVLACSPWNESFKNEGAYAQTTFHVFTKTSNNNPDPNLPLLTYNSPIGSYGAEPIMLDYYLTNAPLHSVAQADSQDEIADWRIRITINGQTFVTDQWQSIYLQGLIPGKNWIKLEYIDELGNPLNNVYNNTAHLITYKPGGQDALSRIIRGEISLKEAFTIVDPEYIYEEPQPEITQEREDVPVTETTTEELDVEETLVEQEREDIPVTETTTEELDVEETLVEQGISQTEPSGLEKLFQTTKEKISEFISRVRLILTNLNKVTTEEEKPNLDTIEEPTVEEILNLPKESETEESLEPNEPPILPEITEEVEILQLTEEVPLQETSNLTPSLEAITEPPEASSIPEVADSQQETTPESEKINDPKSETFVKSIVPESDDALQEVNVEIESENIPDSETVVESVGPESDDNAQAVTTEIESETVVESIAPESDNDDTQEVTTEIESENISKNQENLRE